MLNQWLSQYWFCCWFPPFNFIPWSSPQPNTLYLLPISTTPPLGAFLRNATPKWRLLLRLFVHLQLEFLPLTKNTLTPVSQSRLTSSGISEAAAQHSCSSSQHLQPLYTERKKKITSGFFSVTSTLLSLMVASFRPFRLHRSPDEQTSGGTHQEKGQVHVHSPVWSRWGWFGEACDHRPEMI